MPSLFPTADTIEEHIQHVEEVIINTISNSAPDMDSVRYVFHRLQDDLARFWPQSLPPLPEIKMPNLGAFEVPPPPPPLPVPKTGLERSADWVGAHPWKAVGLGLGVIGAGVLLGYSGRRAFRIRRLRSRAVLGTGADGERRQVIGEPPQLYVCSDWFAEVLLVVVLGGDEPLAFPLIDSLQQCGYIVIASVRTPQAAEELERTSNGYLRAIVLDPTDVRSNILSYTHRLLIQSHYFAVLHYPLIPTLPVCNNVP